VFLRAFLIPSKTSSCISAMSPVSNTVTRLRRQEHRATRSASISSMPGAGARDSIQGIALADPGKTGVVRQCRQRLVQIVARYQRMLKRSAAISMSGRLERTCSKNIANCRRKKRGVGTERLAEPNGRSTGSARGE
jgi:hypothetical protein